MKLTETSIAGVFVAEPERLGDERGWFARTFDAEEFGALGMDLTVVQANASFNAAAGTLRGMHFQSEPYGEPKLVRCVRGAIFDVAVDLRPGSPTFRSWEAVELTAENLLGLYLPVGVAHGFQTLVCGCEVHYLMGHRYVPNAASGVRWDDPAFGIQWPEPPPSGRVISERDLSYPDFAQ